MFTMQKTAILPQKHHRRSVRLKGYDYTQAGAYYITVCSHLRECVFGDIDNGEMKLNEYGDIVKDEWMKTFLMRDNVEMDQFQVMPNHFHAIISICDVGARRAVPLHDVPTMQFGRPVSGSLSTIIRSFKSAVTNKINKLRNTPGHAVWQRNYHEHVIRDVGSLYKIRDYVARNPIDWVTDEHNPDKISISHK